MESAWPFLLPNEPEYIELVYACAWLGVIVVPLNTRLSAVEIDHVPADANPRGLIRHSSFPVPSVKLPWQLVLDKEPLDVHMDSYPDAIYDPEAILAFIYTYVVATEFRRKMLATAAPQFLGISFLTAAHQKNSNATANKGELNEMKSRIGMREDSVATTCAQSAAGSREGRAKM